jgi:hypothetical protein
MSSKEEKEQKAPYTLKGIPTNNFLIQTGDFGWVPHASACGDKEHALEILEVLAKMPKDKERVWITRLDLEKTLAICPIIKEDQHLSQAYAEFFSPQDPSKLPNTKQATGGEGPK